MALIGGFYSFLKLVFGSILSLFIPNLRIANLINNIRSTRAIEFNKSTIHNSSRADKEDKSKFMRENTFKPESLKEEIKENGILRT